MSSGVTNGDRFLKVPGKKFPAVFHRCYATVKKEWGYTEIQPRNLQLPWLYPYLVNLLYERLVKGGDRDCRAIFRLNIRDSVEYLCAAIIYNRMARLLEVYKVMNVIKAFPEASLSALC